MPTTFRVIKAEKLDLSAFAGPIKRGMQNTQKRIAGDYGAGVSTWSHKVGFDNTLSITATLAKASVTTTDQIYGYVHDGTKAHIIRPRRARSLRFQSGYRAKTSAGSINAGAGGSFGATVFSRGVNHPGNAPRNFTEPIAKKNQPLFAKEIEDAFATAASKSGHSI